MRIRGLANSITVARGILAVVLLVLLAAASPHPTVAETWVAFVLFVVAAATDYVDGRLARAWQDTSTFGRIVDPLVDKMLVLGTLVVLLGVEGMAEAVPPWMVAALLLREFIVTVVRGEVEGRGGNFGAVAIGKWKMVVQCMLVGAAILHGAGTTISSRPLPGQDALPGALADVPLVHWIAWAALLVTALSLVSYVRRAVAILAAGRRPPS